MVYGIDNSLDKTMRWFRGSSQQFELKDVYDQSGLGELIWYYK
jgi:hypothetical protein